MARKNNSHHVVPNPSSGWDNKRASSQRASGHYETKREAIDAARVVSRNQGTELFIHGLDGRIQRKDSHGNDPFPPRG